MPQFDNVDVLLCDYPRCIADGLLGFDLFLIQLFIRTIAAGPLCRLVPVDLVSFSRQVLCVKADRVPSPGPVRTIAEGH